MTGDTAVTDTREDRSSVPDRVDAARARARQVQHPRAWMALRGFREFILIAGTYTLYDFTRYLVESSHTAAFRHARDVFSLEHRLHLDPEHALNNAFSPHIWLALPSDYMYAVLHYIVTPVVLVWMWRWHGASYSRARSTLLVATILGLVGFALFPTAPPRLLGGFVDTMAKYQHYGWWSKDASAPRGLGQDTNEFAAMPSLHVGWALWCGWQLFRHSTRRVVRILGAAYPFVLSVVVIATANHYFLDVVAGFAVIGLGALIVRVIASLAWRMWPSLASFSPLNSSPRGPG